ncbi:MAG: hypothetical protein ACHQ9S_22840 [Candidatus Binatia bacterium]
MQSKCERCGAFVPPYDTIHYGHVTKPETLCTACFNRETARQMGLEIAEVNFEPITVSDATGQPHVLQVRRRFCPTGQVVEAFEVTDGAPSGYQFGILGEANAEPMALFAQLYERIRRGLARRHLVDGELGTHLVFPGPVRGYISSDFDRDPEPLPVVVIDGRELTWEEFGRMFLSFEGWQFRMEIMDRTEEV